MNADAEDPPIRSREDFRAAIRAAFAEAADAGCRELLLCDGDFAAWPLGERAVVADLARWMASRRRLTLVASNFDEVARLHPRWVAWRRDWAHVVSCKAHPERDRLDMPTILVATDRFAVQLADPVAFRGRVTRDPLERARCREAIDAILQQSVDAFPVYTTGL